MAICATLYASHGMAMPQGADVKSGVIAGTDKTDNDKMTITQTGSHAVIEWQDFSIAKGETVEFQQDNAQAAVLNRVVGGNVSDISGSLKSNGQVFLINPKGILFGEGAQIDVGSLVASTQNITNENFEHGNYIFKGDSDQSVINNAAITAKGGLVALLASQVENNGTITNPGGTTALAAGSSMNIDYESDGKINLTVDGTALHASVLNTGTLTGGYVLMTARSADQVLSTVVNNTGIIEAASLKNVNGEIVLDAGNTGNTALSGTVSGTFDLSMTGKTNVITTDVATHGGDFTAVGNTYFGLGTDELAGVKDDGTTAVTRVINTQGTDTAGDIILSGNVILATGNAVSLQANTTDAGKTARTTVGAVQVSGTMDSGNAAADGLSAKLANTALVVSADKDSVNLQGNIGSKRALSGLAVANTGNITLGGSLQVTDAAGKTGDVAVASTGKNVFAWQNGRMTTSKILTASVKLQGDVTAAGNIDITGYQQIDAKGLKAVHGSVSLQSTEWNGAGTYWDGDINVTGNIQAGQDVLLSAVPSVAQGTGAARYISLTGTVTAEQGNVQVGNDYYGIRPISFSASKAISAVHGFVDINTKRAITVNAITAGKNIYLTADGGSNFNTGLVGTDTGTITLNGQLKTALSNDNNAVMIMTNGRFVNNAGSEAIQMGENSYWKIASSSPYEDTFGSDAKGYLDSNNDAIWNYSPFWGNYNWGGATGRTFYPGGADKANRYIFAYRPTLTVTANDVVKAYGTASTGSGVSYTNSMATAENVARFHNAGGDVFSDIHASSVEASTSPLGFGVMGTVMTEAQWSQAGFVPSGLNSQTGIVGVTSDGLAAGAAAGTYTVDVDTTNLYSHWLGDADNNIYNRFTGYLVKTVAGKLTVLGAGETVPAEPSAPAIVVSEVPVTPAAAAVTIVPAVPSARAVPAAAIVPVAAQAAVATPASVPQETVPSLIQQKLDHLGTENLDGTGSYNVAAGAQGVPGVSRVAGLNEATLPFFRVADRTVSSYGSYDVAESPERVKLAPSARNLPEPQRAADQYRVLDKTLDMENQAGSFRLVYNGTHFEVYPLDQAAQGILAVGDAAHNEGVAAEALHVSLNEMGIVLADIDAVYIHMDHADL